MLGNVIIDDTGNVIGTAKSDTKLEELPYDLVQTVLENFKQTKYYSQLYTKNVAITKKAIKESVNEDNVIVQTISTMTEVDRTINLFTKRLREWYSVYYPELSQEVSNHQKFVDMVLTQKRPKETMGADLSNKDVTEMKRLAKHIQSLFQLRYEHETYLESIMKTYCPNITELAGVTIGAKLIELGKSLKHLAMLPASTIQLFGAEKALFRHLKTGARSPKYGIIYEHQLIQKAKKSLRGKIARVLADKLSLCARLDYFKGEFKAKEYKKDLERKFG
jgi:nucleolar protein 56